ncbi:hypothetical protein JVU11DRAFT_2950 [Chiua virens]|nr:hypothetical protein JVU11DRAFT_2950 [Chiua virens]
MSMFLDGITALFHKTPQEHLNGMWKIIKKLPPTPPSSHVRVHVYLGWTPGCDDTEFVMRHSALVADFPLDHAGRLSLARVTSKWTLRGCTPIDPCRRAPFELVQPGYLSPLAIRVLTDEGVVKLFEPTPSEGTLAMRDRRLRFVTALDNFWSALHEATLGRLVDTIGLVMTALLLALVVLGVPAALGWYVWCTQLESWLAYYVIVAASR